MTHIQLRIWNFHSNLLAIKVFGLLKHLCDVIVGKAILHDEDNTEEEPTLRSATMQMLSGSFQASCGQILSSSA
jgi:hypothetical protein